MKLSLPRTVETDTVMVELTDGRVVQIFGSGAVTVRLREGHWNEYSLDLPTFVEVVELCPGNPDSNGEIPLTAYHRH